MGVVTRLKFTLVALSIAFVLKVVIFFSPGWAIVNIHFPERIAGDLMEESMEQINSGHPGPGEPVAMPYDKDGIAEGHRLSISMGLWYFVTCLYNKQPHTMFYSKECFHSTYSSAEEEINRLPDSTPFVRGTYEKIHYVTKFGLLEFQIETGLGIICSVIGLITTALYYRTEGNKRHVGLAACVSCLLTGVFFWIAVGKISMSLLHLHEMINMYYGGNMYGIYVPIPWCLVLGAITSSTFLAVAVVHLFIVSRDKDDKKKPAVFSTTSEKSTTAIPVVTTEFYPIERTDLPPFEANTNEDIGTALPLPTKQKL